jgi:hypothetical protein
MSEIELPKEKKVKHLTLLREPRPLTGREFNALSFSERLAMVSAAQSRHKYNLLLEAADAEQLVPRLPAQEIYLLLKELGAEEIPDVLALVTTEQFTTFIDLDAWQGDVLDGKSALLWFSLLLEGGDEENVLRTAREMDFPLLVLTIKKFVTVTRGPEDFLDEDASSARGLEGTYDVEYRDPESAKIVGAFLDIIFRRERDLFIRIMEAARWEQESVLEEDVYQDRVGRLLDHGFPDPAEARLIYTYLSPEAFNPGQFRKQPMIPGEDGVEAPGFILSVAPRGPLLAEVLAGGIDSNTAWELTFLLNKVLSANRVDPGQPEQVQEAMTEVHRDLNLALEHLAGADTARAATLFEEVYLETLFRLGFSLTLDLQRRAKGLKGAKIGPYLEGPFRSLIESLMRKKPMFYEGIETESRGGERPFADLRDLRLAGEWLDRLELQRRLFENGLPFDLPEPAALDLTGCRPDEAGELVLSDFFLTALANRLLGREFLPLPIAEEELPTLHGVVCREGEVSGELRQDTARWLEFIEPGTGAFGDYCLGLWAQGFCPLKSEELEPRFIGGLMVRLS